MTRRCAARQAWNLTELSKVVFLDADPLPLQPIDSLAEHPSAFAAAPDTFPADQFNSGVMVRRPHPSPRPSRYLALALALTLAPTLTRAPTLTLTLNPHPHPNPNSNPNPNPNPNPNQVLRPSSARFAELLAWNQEHGTAEGGDQGLLNEFFGEWFYNAWDHDECGRLPWMMNIAAASFQGARTLARMQSRDEPTIAHFVSGQGKPWLYMVLRFQGQQSQIPPAVQTLAHAWEQLYWLAKSNKVCVGLSSAEKEQTRAQLLDRL